MLRLFSMLHRVSGTVSMLDQEINTVGESDQYPDKQVGE